MLIFFLSLTLATHTLFEVCAMQFDDALVETFELTQGKINVWVVSSILSVRLEVDERFQGNWVWIEKKNMNKIIHKACKSSCTLEGKEIPFHFWSARSSMIQFFFYCALHTSLIRRYCKWEDFDMLVDKNACDFSSIYDLRVRR